MSLNSTPAVLDDELDQARDDSYLDGLDELAQDLEGQNVSRIRSLEKNLENEKKRLASMEMALTEAKKSKESEQKLTIMNKHSTTLSGMLDVLKTMTSREIEGKQDWDTRWREKFADLRQQHLEMEAALKRKHIREMNELKDQIRDEVKRLATLARESNGNAMPSPRTLQATQQQNMARVVALFHKHAQERMYLASKITQQEEMLIRAKNKNLQEKLSVSQARSNQECGKLQRMGLRQVQCIEARDESGDADERVLRGSTTSNLTRKLSTGTSGWREQSSEASVVPPKAQAHRVSAHTAVTMSPRLDGTSTFFTELELDHEPASRPSMHLHSRADWTQQRPGKRAVPQPRSGTSTDTDHADLTRTLPSSPTNLSQDSLRADDAAAAGGGGGWWGRPAALLRWDRRTEWRRGGGQPARQPVWRVGSAVRIGRPQGGD